MADPISLLPTALALGKAVGTIVKFLISLRGSLRKADTYLIEASNYQCMIDQSFNEFGRLTPWMGSEHKGIMLQLFRGKDICEEYMDLLGKISKSRMRSVQAKLKEQDVEEQAQRLERSKNSLTLAMSWASCVAGL